MRRIGRRKVLSAKDSRPAAGGWSSLPQDIVRRLDFTFYTGPVDASLKALGLWGRTIAGRRELVMKVLDGDTSLTASQENPVRPTNVHALCPFGKSAEGPQLPSTASRSEIRAAAAERKTARPGRAGGVTGTWFAGN